MISHTVDAVVLRPKRASHFSSQGPSALVSRRIQRVRRPERPALQSPHRIRRFRIPASGRIVGTRSEVSLGCDGLFDGRCQHSRHAWAERTVARRSLTEIRSCVDTFGLTVCGRAPASEEGRPLQIAKCKFQIEGHRRRGTLIDTDLHSSRRLPISVPRPAFRLSF